MERVFGTLSAGQSSGKRKCYANPTGKFVACGVEEWLTGCLPTRKGGISSGDEARLTRSDDEEVC